MWAGASLRERAYDEAALKRSGWDAVRAQRSRRGRPPSATRFGDPKDMQKASPGGEGEDSKGLPLDAWNPDDEYELFELFVRPQFGELDRGLQSQI